MLQVLINHNDTLRKLQAEKFVMEVCDGWLIIHHIPYINSNNECKDGTLLMPLTISGTTILKPRDHTAYWIGEWPCDVTAHKLPSLVNSEQKRTIVSNYRSDYYFSCHADCNIYPPNGDYPDFYEKVHTYFDMISAPAFQLDTQAWTKINKPIIYKDESSPLLFMDTNASRANISMLSEKYKGLKIAIIGLGGTGSYILDMVAKTPVAEIHLYDRDVFNDHNAYRAPGSPTVLQLTEALLKVDYFGDIYSRMHSGIVKHASMITESNITELGVMDYVFISIDKVAPKQIIANYLLDKHIPFIESGMGIFLQQNKKLSGLIHIAIGTHDKYEHLDRAFGNPDADQDMYTSDIQIAELNSFAACESVIRWKKLIGFYEDSENEYMSLYSINDNDIENEN